MTEPSAVHTSVFKSSEAIDIVFVAAGIGLQYALPLALPWDEPILRYGIGGAFLLLTVILVVWSMRAFKSHAQSPKPNSVTSTLMISGPFRFSRNPMYLASLMLFLCLALVFANYWFAILLPLLVAAFNVWMIRPEERFLAARFGDEYDSYCRRVRRWI